MKILDASEGLCSQSAISQARSVAKTLPPNGAKTLIQFLTPGNSDQDYFVLRVRPSSITVINANRFRITGASNDEAGVPTLTWKSGVPPFVVKLIYSSVDGTTQIFDTTGMAVNLNTNLTDGTGDIVTSEMPREYAVTKIVDADGWWADDLEDVVTDSNRQNAIGLQIEDASGRKLFAPFTPQTGDIEGIPNSPLATLYTHYGPDTWCVPTINWSSPAGITYGTKLEVGVTLNAVVYVPGTETLLPGVFKYWLDADYTIPAENTVPVVNSGLPLYVTFQATDAVHYRLAAAESGVVVNKYQQVLGEPTNYQSSPYIGGYVIHTMRRPLNRNSGLDIVGSTTTPSLVSLVGIVDTRVVNPQETNPEFGPWLETDIKWTLTGAGFAHISYQQPGDSNYLASNVQSKTVTISVGSGGTITGTFDVNDPQPIVYGTGFDFLVDAGGLAGNPSYAATAHEPQGWRVTPAWGTLLQCNADGTNKVNNVFADFYPNDTTNYPSPMEYMAGVEVTQDTPIIDWTPSTMTFGDPWSTIMTAVWRNSINGSAVNGTTTYTVSGHANATFNGVISDPTKIPDADTGIFIVCSFVPDNSGISDSSLYRAHNYKNPAPTGATEYGVVINKRPVWIVPTTDVVEYGPQPIAFTSHGPGGDSKPQANGLMLGDDFSGELSAGFTPSATPYAITIGTLSAGANYDLTTNFDSTKTRTINKRQLVLSALSVYWGGLLSYDAYKMTSYSFGTVTAKLNWTLDDALKNKIAFSASGINPTSTPDIEQHDGTGSNYSFAYVSMSGFTPNPSTFVLTLTASLTLTTDQQVYYIAPTPISITRSNSTLQADVTFPGQATTYNYGSSYTITATTDPAGKTVTYSYSGGTAPSGEITVYGPSATKPTNAGYYVVTATVDPATGYTGTGIFAYSILKVNCTVRFDLPASILAGQSLLDVSAAASVYDAGNTTYLGMPVNYYFTKTGSVFSQPLRGNGTNENYKFAPSSGVTVYAVQEASPNYNVAYASDTMVVKETVTITSIVLPSLTPTMYFPLAADGTGTGSSVTAKSSNGVTVACTYIYKVVGGAWSSEHTITSADMLPIGTYQLRIYPTLPGGTGYYLLPGYYATYNLSVGIGTVSVSWTDARTITYSAGGDGTGITAKALMDAVALDGSTNVTSHFTRVYEVQAGGTWKDMETTALAAGEYFARVTFTPTGVDYASPPVVEIGFTMQWSDFAYSVAGNVVTISGKGCGQPGGYLASRRYGNGTINITDDSIIGAEIVFTTQSGPNEFKFTLQKISTASAWARNADVDEFGVAKTGILFTDLFNNTKYVPFQAGFTPPVKAVVTLTVTPVSPVYYEGLFTFSTLTAKVGASDIAGTWSFRAVKSGFDEVISVNQKLNAGSYTVTATFTPTDTVVYSASPVNFNFTVNPVAPVMSWGTAGIVPAYFTPAAQTVKAASMNATAKHPVSNSNISADYETKTYEIQLYGYWYSLINNHIYTLGDYPVRASFSSSNPNYASGSVTATLHVTAAAMAYSRYAENGALLPDNYIRISGGRPYGEPYGYFPTIVDAGKTTNATVDYGTLSGDSFIHYLHKSNTALPWSYADSSGGTFYFEDQDHQFLAVPFQAGFTIPLKASQTISAITMSAPVYLDPIFGRTARIWQTATLSPQNSSAGLPVVFSSSNPAVASVSGRTITCNGVGSCTIYANQAGQTSDPQYAAAGQVSTSFRVLQSVSYTVMFDNNIPLQNPVMEGWLALPVLQRASYASIAGTWEYRADSTGGALVTAYTTFPRDSGKLYYAQFTPYDSNFVQSDWLQGGLVCTGLVWVRSYKAITGYNIHYGQALSSVASNTSLVTVDNSTGQDVKSTGTMSFEILDGDGGVRGGWDTNAVFGAGSWFFKAIFTPSSSEYQAGSDWTGFNILRAPLTVLHSDTYLNSGRAYGDVGWHNLVIALINGNITFMMNSGIVALSMISLQQQYGTVSPMPVFNPDGYDHFNVKFWCMQADFTWKQYVDNGGSYNWFITSTIFVNGSTQVGSMKAMFKVSVETDNFEYSESSFFWVTINY